MTKTKNGPAPAGPVHSTHRDAVPALDFAAPAGAEARDPLAESLRWSAVARSTGAARLTGPEAERQLAERRNRSGE